MASQSGRPDTAVGPNGGATQGATPAAHPNTQGPDWKPAKVPGQNYGAAVSAAAKAKSNPAPAPSTTPPTPKPPTTSHAVDTEGDGNKIPASRTGSPQSGADHRSITAPEVRRAAGIPKSNPTMPARSPHVQIGNPGIHDSADSGPSWKPQKVSGQNYGRKVSAAARARTR